MEISNYVFDQYYEAVDWLIASSYTGHNIVLVYPPKKVPCEDHAAHFGGTSKNVYQHGGPAPFNNISCPLCGGNGWKEEEVKGNIRCRAYWSKRNFIKISGYSVPNAEVQIIGYLTDLDKLRRSNYVIIRKNNTDHKFKLLAEPFDWGFGNRYFVAFLERA